ncbi:MAG: hypothetical protein LBT16_03445 [Treponema sp.]|jgi:hypothetical protein|nr:hypothetical protein [Treponema sp.]
MKGEKPHFFCENCGTEVPLHAKSCPGCGRAFQAVRCPACNFVGEEALFKGGCPVCGYIPSNGPERANQGKTTACKAAGALPPWVYIVSALAALAVVALILRWLF